MGLISRWAGILNLPRYFLLLYFFTNVAQVLYNDGCTLLSVLATISIPPGMVQDQFGMMGLLTFIRGAETDPNLVALALGR